MTPAPEAPRPGAPDAHAWLDAFEAAVRARDFDAGRALFVGDALGFGSVVPRCDGLDPLVAGQWRRVWPNIERFTFERDRARVVDGGDVVVIATTWTSVGRDGEGQAFERPGRVTLVLRRTGGRLACEHSHYSLVPGTERALAAR